MPRIPAFRPGDKVRLKPEMRGDSTRVGTVGYFSDADEYGDRWVYIYWPGLDEAEPARDDWLEMAPVKMYEKTSSVHKATD